jgi:hypothetical protein
MRESLSRSVSLRPYKRKRQHKRKADPSYRPAFILLGAYRVHSPFAYAISRDEKAAFPLLNIQ